MFLLVFLFALLFEGSLASQQHCQARNHKNGIVCVCNSTLCDTVPKPEKIQKPYFLIYTSNQAGLRFHQTSGTFKPFACPTQIFIDKTKEFQKILGFGGAFTDSTAININSLPENLQEALLKSYFSEEGVEYSLCRVPMGATDFSSRIYTYDDGPADPHLVNFKLAEEDLKYKIPYLQKALEMGQNLRFFASPWVVPKWMKTAQDYKGWGFIRKDMYQSWADYFVRFLDEYHNHGIPFWGITTGNEPMDPWVRFDPLEVVAWPAWLIGDWLANNLGPTLRASKHSHVKIMILDDQRAYIPWYIERLCFDNGTREYIDGIAVHWYLNRYFNGSLLSKTHEMFPDKFILSTEASNEPNGGESVPLGSWERGERYSFDIIENMHNWVSGWIDWNMVLDLNGGPNCISNFVDAPIIVNATGGEFYKQPMYYHVGHFSKFVPPGSVRIHSECHNKKVEAVAFRRPDKATVLVLLNRDETSVTLNIKDNCRGAAQIRLTERSITTIVYW